jgi:uncharacterized membrane protein YedE/YeeE
VLEVLARPWPWYVAGPLLGLMVPVLLLLGNRLFGFSSNFRHLCAALAPGRVTFFHYDWRGGGSWNLAFLAGTLLGAAVAGRLLGVPDVALAADTREALAALGMTDFSGLAPREIFAWSHLLGPTGVAAMVAGGLLVGFGTAWAGGCTSGHGITGLASLERESLIAVLGFFAGGIIGTHLLLPWIL